VCSSPDTGAGVFHFTSSSNSDDDDNAVILYQLLQQLMIKLHLTIMVKQQLIITQTQLSALMKNNLLNNDVIGEHINTCCSHLQMNVTLECFTCKLLEGPSDDLIGHHYTLKIFVDQVHVMSNHTHNKWVWLLTELYSYTLDQEEVDGMAYVTIQVAQE